jgi:hypothetical protein
MPDTPGSFYLGKHLDPKTSQPTTERMLYDPADLTTHAVVTGMTGSGKTGICIDILEEAALQGIPAIIVDPKGDLTNLLLHFPDLAPQDFEPWLDPDSARRAGKSLPDLASETALKWKQGLTDWGLGSDQIRALQAGVKFSVYTPGSSAGISVNILSSFEAPKVSWNENREVLREKIATTVTALLGLIGMEDIDPLRSREHILLSNLIEQAWSQGKSLDLTDLIMQVQTPPIQRLGAFPLESFFPEKDRFGLAMLLNNFLASPSFETWLEGQPLDIAALLYTPEGRPRHSIFYLAHLTDNERMFFVTLLFASFEAWMRTQRGTSSLRALLYFDEIVGYLPPVANPPSRPILLRMLKQARAFGVGLLLATQNPVDVDYKALSNAGTWIIGRLQTPQDIERLIDGLQTAGASASLMDRAALQGLISSLQKRAFLIQNVHGGAPQVFTSRWTMNFLAGPLTRAQIPDLNRLADAPVSPAATASIGTASAAAATAGAAGAATGATVAASPAADRPTQPRASVQTQAAPPQAAAPVQRPAAASNGFLSTRPAVSAEISEYFLADTVGMSQATAGLNLPPTLDISAEGILYRPALIAQTETRYLQRKYNLDYSKRSTALVMAGDTPRIRWEDSPYQPQEPSQLHSDPLPRSQFAPLPGWLSDAKRLKSLQADFIDWVYRSGTVRVRANETLKVYAGPDTSPADFRELCSQAARSGLEAEIAKIKDTYERKISVLEQKVSRQELEVKGQEDVVSKRTMEELGSNGELLLSMFTKRRRSLSTSLTKRRLTSQAKTNLEQEREELAAMEKQLDDLEAALKAAVGDAQNRWAQTVNDGSEVPIVPMKKDIYPELFGVAWLPYYLLKVDGKMVEAPAFEAAMK